MAILEVESVHTYYGHIHALKGISLTVEAGEIVTLIGANGAGKSTILNTVAGLQRPDRGEIFYRGANIAGRQAHQTVKLGLALVPEGRRVFGNLTVYENLRLAGFQLRSGEIEQRIRRVYAYFPRLEERKAQLGDTLSGGEQQMLAVGRALVTGGQCMLLDEPSMGLAPILVQQIFEILREINRQGTTILLVEQNAHMALKLAHRAYVLETGNIVLSGPSKEVAASPDVQKAYLGG
jgi:branched-chain amino acid transport system ATP-binding protein